MKLTYFSGRGKAEVARLLLAYGNVDYENERITSEDWPKIKPGTPYELLPILEVDDGVIIGESNAIARFLAKKVGLYGDADDAVTQAHIDMVIDNIGDIDSGWLYLLFIFPLFFI